MALGRKKGNSTYLCSSSSSSLVIIDLYWFPLSFPGLYLKENISSAAGQGQRERQRRAREHVSQRPPESNDPQQRACSLEVFADSCSRTTPNTTTTLEHASSVSSSLQKARAVPGKPCGLQQRAELWLAGGRQETRLQQRGLLRVTSPAGRQMHVNPTAREPYALALPGFQALQAHLGLSRHANPALISSQHFPLLLSRPAFLLPPAARAGALSHAGGSRTVPRAELSQAMLPSSSPAAPDKACD